MKNRSGKYNLILILVLLLMHTFALAKNCEQAEYFTSLEAAKINPLKVKCLDLDGQNYQKFPLEILTFKNLEVLNLNRNLIRIIPYEIGNLKKLVEFKIKENHVEHVPSSITKLKLLQKIDLSNNYLSHLTFDLAKIDYIKSINLSNNYLEIGSIRHIERQGVSLYPQNVRKDFWGACQQLPTQTNTSTGIIRDAEKILDKIDKKIVTPIGKIGNMTSKKF